MKVLIVGNGAREHAIAWKVAASPLIPEVLTAPGNAGTASLGTNCAVDAEDVDGLLALAQSEQVDLTIVGPEGPLAAGIVDRFEAAGRRVFGPTAAAARIESSKSFAKEVMAAAGVPTAGANVFTNLEDAVGFIESTEPPHVVKADGLAAGKGVTVATDRAQAIQALRDMFVSQAFGPAGDTVLIEECMTGQEVSIFAFVDGSYVSPLTVACDYKRAQDGDVGPNTGGMGSYSPPPNWDTELDDIVRTCIMQPVADQMVQMGCPFRGVLYGGVMLTSEGPRVFEFNCRMGDPEAQVVIPRLKSDLLEIALAASEGRLSGCAVEWSGERWVGVVMASGGYPGAYETGVEVTGLDSDDRDRVVFHAGTRLEGGAVVTSGGRVVTATARGGTIAEARLAAYDLAGQIRFANAYYRTDIADLN